MRQGALPNEELSSSHSVTNATVTFLFASSPRARLHRELRSRGIMRLVVAGLQTEYCVDTTCRRAYSLGYEIILVGDAHRTWDSDSLSASQIIDHHNNVLGGWFATLRKNEEITF